MLVSIKQTTVGILSVVLYGCETRSPTLRAERRLRVIDNRVLRKIFGPNTDEVTGEWRNTQYLYLLKKNIYIKCNMPGMPVLYIGRTVLKS
jgi:hypothetical protein